MKVKFKKLHPNAKLPTKAHPTDACYDVWAVSVEVTPDFVRYKLGFSVEIPDGWEMVIRPRSSNSKKDLVLCNSVATIDAPYRGEIELRFKPTLPCEVVINIGSEEFDRQMAVKYKGWKPKMYDIDTEAVAQLCIKPIYDIEWEETETLTSTDRGDGGFGSTNERTVVNPELRDGDGS